MITSRIKTALLLGLVASPLISWAVKDLVRCVKKRVEGRKKLTLLMNLIITSRISQYIPRRLTIPGSHYMITHEGLDCYAKIDGFKRRMTPVLDVITVDEVRLQLLPCVPIALVLEVESHRIDDNYIDTIVVGKYLTFSVDPQEPEFMKFGANGVFARGYMEGESPMVDVQVAPFVGCQLPQVHFEELRLRTGKTPNLGYMEFNAKDMDVARSEIPTIAQALKEELRVVNFEPWIQPICLGGDGDNEVQFLDDEYDANLYGAKPAGKILPSMLDKESVNIAFNKSSEIITVDDRVRKYTERAPVEVPEVYKKYVNEYLMLLIPEKDKHSLAPDDVDVVLERQSRPVQLLDYLETVNNVWDKYSQDSTFQKREIYPPKIPAARNIVNPPPQKRVAVGRFASPLTLMLKGGTLRGIYGFGPADYVMSCFDRVARQNAEQPELKKYLTDFTKLDATITKFFRDLELKIAKRAYKECYHEELEEVYSSQYLNRYPKMGKGTKVDMKYIRRSGEGWTSLGNTLDNIFVQFSTLRQAGFSPKDAFSKLGCSGGDDGMMVGYATEELLVQTAADLGLIIKVEAVQADAPFNFLGIVRLHPEMQLYTCDPARFTTKCAYSHVKNVPWEELAYRKCEPYARLYSNVPLVGNFARAVIRLLDKQGYKIHSRFDELCRGMNGFIMTIMQDEQFPGPTTEEEYALVEEYVSSVLNLPLGQLREVNRLYNEALTFEDFPTGFIKYTDIISYDDVKYECLLRDLYIPGSARMKFVDCLHTEELSGCTKSIDGEKQENQKQNSEECSSSSGSTTDGHGQSTITREEAPPEPQKKRKRRRGRKPPQ